MCEYEFGSALAHAFGFAELCYPFWFDNEGKFPNAILDYR